MSNSPDARCNPPVVQETPCLRETEDGEFVFTNEGGTLQREFEQSVCDTGLIIGEPIDQPVVELPSILDSYPGNIEPGIGNSSQIITSRILLERFVANDKVSIVQGLSGDVHVLQVEKKFNTHYRVLDTNTNVYLGGIFDANKLTITDNNGSSTMYGPLGNFTAIAQFNNSIISFKPNVSKGNSWKDNDGNMVYEDLVIGIYDKNLIKDKGILDTSTISLYNKNRLYNNEKLIFDTVDEELAFYDSAYKRTEIQQHALSGIVQGFLTNTEASFDYFDFTKHSMYGASFKLKSPWNMIFDIDAEYNETEDVNYASNNILHRQGRINNTRSYHNMNICNKDIWLSYTNKQNWASNDDENSILDKRNNILAPINVYNVPGANPSMIYTYQQVERIKGIKTFGLYPKHKSNIYSIRIKDSGLNNNLNLSVSVL